MADRVEVLITGDASRLSRAAEDAKNSLASLGRSAQETGRAIASSFTQANLERGIGSLKTGLGVLSGGLTKIAAPLFAADIAFKALDSTLGSVVASWDKYTSKVAAAETATLRLTALYDGNAEAIGRVRDLTKELASQSSFFGAGAITNAAIVLKNFDATEQQIKTLLPAAVKLSTLFGTDLEETTRKFAIGLTGATRGLREFGIVVPAGANQADVFRLILEKAAKAEGVMNEANDTLAASQRNLTKAQGGYNKAIGEFLAGPAKAYNDFLASLYVSVTKLIKAVGDFGKAWEKSMTGGQEGIRLEPLGTRRSYGPPAPGTAAGMALAAQGGRRVTPADVAPALAEAGKKAGKEAGIQWAKAIQESTGSAKEVGKAAGREAAREFYSGIGPGVLPGVNVLVASAIQAEEEVAKGQQSALEARIAAAEEEAIKNQKAAQELIDNADEANKKRNEETVKAFETAQSLIEQANKDFASGITAAGRLLVDIVRGDASLGGLIRAFGGVAGAAGGALGGPIGAALAGVGVEVVAAIVDGFKPQQTAADKLREAGDRLTQAGQAMTEAERERRIEKAKDIARAAGLTESDIARAMDAARNPNSQPGNRRTQGFPAVGETLTLGPIDAAAVQKNYMENVLGPSKLPGTIAGRPGEGGLLSPGGEAPGPAPQELAKAQSEAAFSELVRIMREIYSIQLDESGKGMTERQPLFVFDVAAGKDEFTRAPRGMFFRPVGSGRGVDAGQSVSGVSANTSNRAASGRTDRSRRMA